VSMIRVVAFDGTPVEGGAGMRTAVLERKDGSFVTTGRRRRSVQGDDMRRLIDDGYVTAVSLPIHAELPDGIVAYRHREFVLPGVALHDDDQVWRTSGDIDVAYLDADAAASMFERYARAAHVLASAAHAKREADEANRLARRGLMITPRLRSSPVAARLYGVLLATAIERGSSESIQREMGIMLDDVRVAQAVSMAAAALLRGQRGVADAGRIDRRLLVGSPDAPWEAA
jgi:hypothetical protein